MFFMKSYVYDRTFIVLNHTFIWNRLTAEHIASSFATFKIPVKFCDAKSGTKIFTEQWQSEILVSLKKSNYKYWTMEPLTYSKLIINITHNIIILKYRVDVRFVNHIGIIRKWLQLLQTYVETFNILGVVCNINS